MIDEIYVLAFELLGTAAFAVSGALTAVGKKMDVLGVMILGLTTATGGGIIRDITLGYTPPAAFRNPVYSLVALLVSLIIFLPPVRKTIGRHEAAFNNILTVVDAIGLGVFTVIGIQAAHSETNAHGVYLYLFVGVVTGVGDFRRAYLRNGFNFRRGPLHNPLGARRPLRRDARGPRACGHPACACGIQQVESA